MPKRKRKPKRKPSTRAPSKWTTAVDFMVRVPVWQMLALLRKAGLRAGRLDCGQQGQWLVTRDPDRSLASFAPCSGGTVSRMAMRLGFSADEVMCHGCGRWCRVLYARRGRREGRQEVGAMGCPKCQGGVYVTSWRALPEEAPWSERLHSDGAEAAVIAAALSGVMPARRVAERAGLLPRMVTSVSTRERARRDAPVLLDEGW